MQSLSNNLLHLLPNSAHRLNSRRINLLVLQSTVRTGSIRRLHLTNQRIYLRSCNVRVFANGAMVISVGCWILILACMRLSNATTLMRLLG